ncbi:hypothetical protein SERLA73DRAFT_99306 [Serpula lacrymans var. lacrymans S7.3]|uniref:Anaphase-promoting complex subunit 5 n=1 Tax=Serpula lacrymans var. lacrymans (strain S7.3) TaxID=936435 RepID=F8QGZ0_SERL3|nr:hypothetical protein SERLA73DRAFT_99306 [Serpula lacrymans var. lacrymans S7.3]
MEEGPPPINHVLRPHHIDLVAIMLLVFKEFTTENLPPPFLLHVYRLLLHEVAEATEPRSHEELLQDLSSAPMADEVLSHNLITALKSVPGQLRSPEQLSNFFQSTPFMFVEKNEDEPPILLRRSLFGYFCRRCFVSFLKLSYFGIGKLHEDYQAWCAGDRQAGYAAVEKDPLSTDMLIFKTQSDTKTWAQPEPFANWENGLSAGDDIAAAENLRRYFEQHFHENNDSGVRQHALLNLVRMHYIRGESVAARQVRRYIHLLQEAIAVARTSGDRITLQHCISMLHRLPEPSEMPTLNEIQPDLHPLEILFDISKLLDPRSGQPLTACFEKLVQASGLYDHWIETGRASYNDKEKMGIHAMEAVLWTTIGCVGVAEMEEDYVLAFTVSGTNDPNRLNVILNRAYRLARSGDYDQALGMLIDPDVWWGLSMDSYALWTDQIWHILALRTSRRGQSRLFQDYLRPRRPTSNYIEKEYWYDDSPVTIQTIQMDLHRVMDARQHGQVASAIEPLLTSLWNSEFQGRFPLYRLSIILLADVGLELGQTKRCRQILEEILPQVISGNELEHRALACFTLAKCIIACSEMSADGLREALPHLLMAEADYASMQILRPLMDVQYLLSVVYHNLDMQKEQDEAAARHLSTKNILGAFEEAVVDDEVSNIWDVVTQIGAKLASR